MGKKKECFLILELVEEGETADGETQLKFSWARGMIGVMPVFSNRKSADAYAKKRDGATVLPLINKP